MTDIVLKDIDDALRARIERVAGARGWAIPAALLTLLETGLDQCEARQRAPFSGREDSALAEAIAAMEQVPDDPGFSLIGRMPASDDADPQPAG